LRLGFVDDRGKRAQKLLEYGNGGVIDRHWASAF
jgi:hypothetical protein